MSKASETEPTIEAKLEQLRTAVQWFESEDFTVEEAMSRFEAASKLATEIEHELEAVKNTVTVLKEKFSE